MTHNQTKGISRPVKKVDLLSLVFNLLVSYSKFYEVEIQTAAAKLRWVQVS